MRYELTIFGRNKADKSHYANLALHDPICLTDSFVFTPGKFLDLKVISVNKFHWNHIQQIASCNPNFNRDMVSNILKPELKLKLQVETFNVKLKFEFTMVRFMNFDCIRT